MENQLVTLSLSFDPPSVLDPSLQSSISVSLSSSCFSETQNFPFIFGPFPISALPFSLSFTFSHNSIEFGSSCLTLSSLSTQEESFKISHQNSDSSPHLSQISQFTLSLVQSNPASNFINSSICHDIALNIQELIRNPKEFSIKQVENLRTLIIGLNSKLKSLILLQQRVASLEAFSLQSIEKREETQKQVLQTCAKLDQHNDSVSEKFKEMNLIRENLQIELNQVLAKFRDKCVEEERLNGELKIKESEIDRLKGELRNFEAIENFIKNLQKEAKSLEQERESLRAEYKSSISTFTEDLAARDLEIFNRDEEILRLSDIISSKDSEIFNLNSESSHKSSQILSLQSSIVELTQVITSYKDLESKCKSLEALSKSHQSECVSLQSRISENLSSYKSSISLLSQEKDSNFQTISALQVEMQKLSTDLHEKLALYRSEQIITQELRTKSAIIQQKLCNTLDLNKLFTQVKYLSGQMTELRDKLVEDNDELVRQVLQITEDYLNAGKVIQQVRDIIEDRDNEINILRDLIAELQNKTIYYPIKDDPVDEAIADYLNSRSEPLPVTFIREEYGIYLFGTKRVFIKLENNRIISKD